MPTPSLFKSVAILGLSLLAIDSHAVSTIRNTLHSEAMDKDVDYAIVIPDSYNSPSNADKTYPVLYALHGYGAPYDTWAVMLPLNNAINSDYPAIIVTFEGETSFYIDFDGNPSVQFTTFFFDELIPFVETTYRAGGHSSLRAVTGFSMGGFGAWHYMLTHPDMFSSVSALSGAFNFNPNGQTETNPYGRITTAAANQVELPPMYLNCGTSDSLIGDNRNMKQHLTDKGYSVELIETEGAQHNWTFWRGASDELIAWHYQYLSAPSETWRGLPIYPDGTVYTGDSLGWIHVANAPWVWVYKLSAWAYIGNDSNPVLPHWFWISKQS